MGEPTPDTWGIPGPEFLGIYILFFLVALFASIALRLVVTRWWGRTSQVEQLSPAELGMLNSDRNAVMAALAQLRAAGIVSSDGPDRPLNASDRQHLDPFTIGVLHATAHLPKRTVRASMAAAAQPLRELRANLVDRFHLTGPSFRFALLLAAAPIDLVLILGIARIAAGISNGKPVGFLVFLTIVVAISWLFFLPKPRMTARGRQAMAHARRAMTYLNPVQRPSLTTYGAAHAGMSAALFGGAALWLLDPDFAQLTEADRVISTGSSSSFTSTSSCSSSSSSCSSGSSCGGGGGGGCGG